MLSTSSAPVASQLSRILVVVVQKVGIGVAALRQMIGWFHGGKNAGQVLACMNQMAQLDRRDAPTRTEPSCFFVLNGAQSGLYMGGDSEWVWGEGYTFAAWIWKDGNEQGDVVLLRLLGTEFEGGRPSNVLSVVIRTEKRSGTTMGAARLFVQIGDGSRCSEVDTQLTLPTSRWTHVAVSHEYAKVKTSVLTAWVDGSKSVTALKYPAAQMYVRAYVGCLGMKRDSMQTQRAFKGLLASVRVWRQPLSYAAIAEAQLLSESADAQGKTPVDDADAPRPHFSASAGSAAFLPGIHLAAGEQDPQAAQGQVAHGGYAELTATARAVGVLRVGGRVRLVAALEALGHLDLLLWMLQSAVREREGAERVGQGGAGGVMQAGDATVACEVVCLIKVLVEHSALVRCSLLDKRQVRRCALSHSRPQTDRQTDSQSDRQTDRHTDTDTHTHTHTRM